MSISTKLNEIRPSVRRIDILRRVCLWLHRAKTVVSVCSDQCHSMEVLIALQSDHSIDLGSRVHDSSKLNLFKVTPKCTQVPT